MKPLLHKMGSRLAAGPWTLTPVTEVRILSSQSSLPAGASSGRPAIKEATKTNDRKDKAKAVRRSRRRRRDPSPAHSDPSPEFIEGSGCSCIEERLVSPAYLPSCSYEICPISLSGFNRALSSASYCFAIVPFSITHTLFPMLNAICGS